MDIMRSQFTYNAFSTKCFMTRTKLRTIFTILSGIILLLSSCCQQEESNFLSNNPLSLTCIQSTWTGTRAVIDNEGKGSFSEGDKIEVLATGEKKTATIPLEYTDGQWTPFLQRNDYGTGNLTLSALFPLLAQDNGGQNQRSIYIGIFS